MELANQGRPVRQEGASYFQDFIGVGGQLVLTEKKLCFCTNTHALKQCELEISLNDINDVTFFRTLKINPNGLTVMLKNGTIENFVVDDRDSWRKSIIDQKRLTKA